LTSEATPARRPDSPTDAVSERPARLLALSGTAFAMLLLFGWFLSGGDTPDYAAANGDWIDWAEKSGSRSGIGAFLVLLAGIAFLHFVGTIRDALGSAEIAVRGSTQLARTAFAGAIAGIVGITMAIVMIAAASSTGAGADPIVSRAVTTASAGPYLVATMGFATLLGASGLSTLQTRVFARWTGIVALLGAVAFLVTFLTVLGGTGEDSMFGYAYLPGILALATWAIATSAASYRAPAVTRSGLM
jgi:hypothetical protein